MLFAAKVQCYAQRRKAFYQNETKILRQIFRSRIFLKNFASKKAYKFNLAIYLKKFGGIFSKVKVQFMCDKRNANQNINNILTFDLLLCRNWFHFFSSLHIAPNPLIT